MRKIDFRWGTTLTLLCVLCIVFGINAQNRNLKFDRLSTDEGLSQSNVYSIYEDRLGYIWVATEDGLNLYDGYEVKVFVNDPDDPNSLRTNRTTAIFEDGRGDLWIGHRYGISKYDRDYKNFINYTNDPSDPASMFNGGGVWRMFRDSRGDLWIGMNNGLSKWMHETGTFKNYMHDPAVSNSLVANSIYGIAEDNTGRIWIAADGGVSMLNSDGETFTNYLFDPANPQNILASKDNRSIFCDSQNRLWIGSFDNGLSILNLNDFSVRFHESRVDVKTTLSDNLINKVVENEKGEIWIATDNGLNLFNPNGTFERVYNDPNDISSLSSNIVVDIIFDRNQRMWTGTRFGGLSIYDEHKYGFQLFQNTPNNPNGLSSNTTTGFAVDAGGNFYISTDGAGINYYNRETGKFSHIRHDPENPNSLTNNKVLTMEVDSNGELWLGMWGGGVNRYDPITGKVTHYINDPQNDRSLGGNNIFDIYEDRNGDIWIGSWGNGLSKYVPETDDFTNFSNNPETGIFPNGSLSSILEDDEGNFWMANGSSGVVVFNPKTEIVKNYRAGNEDGALSEDGVLAILIDSKKRIWVGTNGGGLNLLDRSTDKFRVFKKKHGLPNDVVTTILEADDGNLWMGTNRGLSRFNPETETFRNYFKVDGIQSNQFVPRNALKLSTGELLFGGIGGFNLFNPRDLFDNPVEPLVYITKFKLYDKEIHAGSSEIIEKSITFTDHITLKHNQNLFSFDYTGVSYRHTEKNQYRYILEGLHDDWVEAGTRRNVSFMNLEPGKYTFKVNASNNDGVWSSQPAELKITVVPPFWNTWWFRISMVVLIAGLIFWFLRSKSLENKKAQEELRKKIQDATGEVEKQNEELQGQSESLRLAIEETNFVVREAVDSGNFEARIDLESKTGEWKALGKSINELFDSVTHPFNSINFIVNKLAQGDLTERYREEARGDIQRLKENLNIAMDNVSELLLDISVHVDEIKSSSSDMLVSSEEMNISTGEIASSIAEMSKGAQEQVDKVDESSNLIEGVLRFSSEMGNQAESINNTAKMGVDRSEDGKKRVTDLDVSMKDILEFSSKTNDSIDALTKRSEEISTVLRIIKDIASQTNLLALNAAIEAAQAGDAGRGFAVVAEEIRKLAEDSKKSAGEIEELVKGVQNYTSSTADLMGQMNQRIKQGEEATAHTKEAFEEITRFYSETLDKSEQILAATKQQTEDIGNVVNIINGVVVIAEETAAGTEETASSSSQLSVGMTNYTDKTKKVSAIADELKSKVAKFDLGNAMEFLNSSQAVET